MPLFANYARVGLPLRGKEDSIGLGVHVYTGNRPPEKKKPNPKISFQPKFFAKTHPVHPHPVRTRLQRRKTLTIKKKRWTTIVASGRCIEWGGDTASVSTLQKKKKKFNSTGVTWLPITEGHSK